jgi:FSR family fosmidomycin resistance protein-like MFS transporter
VFGAWAAAWPSIRSDLGLSYVQVGVLISLPHIFGCILEPPLGLLGDAWNRRALIRAGGIAFALALAAIALSAGFPALLVALMLISPASGAFVSLSQATLMDMDPARHEQNMARWTLAGSIGMVAGPVALAIAAAAGFGWRAAFASGAVLTVTVLAAAWRMPMATTALSREPIARALRASAGGALSALRNRDVVRWLTLLQFSDLMLDVLHGFLALYFVDVVGASGASAAFAVAIWTGVGLIGDVLVIGVLERVDGARWLRASAAATLIVFPAFLLVEGTTPKLIALGALGLLNSGWYAVLQGRLYSALPGQSATVMALSSGFGTLGGLLPLTIGLVAQQLGIGSAMWLLLAGPIALLMGLAPAANCCTRNQSHEAT